MLTIYEKESLFESLDEIFAEIKAYIEWIEEKLYALQGGKVGSVIGGLRRRQTKNQDRLTKQQKKRFQKPSLTSTTTGI